MSASEHEPTAFSRSATAVWDRFAFGLSTLALFASACSGPPGVAHAPPVPPAVDVPSLEDRVSIRDLIDRATDAINHHEWQRLGPLFTDDAVWEALPPIGWQLRGREAILAFLSGNAGKVEVLSYSLGATAIKLDGADRATTRSTMHELLRLHQSETGLQIVGTYSDELRKQNGKWRFTRRSFRLRYEDDVDLPERLSPTTSRAGAVGKPR
ncbi:MAG TPA: nuclear transport factor 2 family protein [Polyangiaceae bacterium]|nr:nuclear transport factor 2 family protein [Polyangiaceae bacterium]